MSVNFYLTYKSAVNSSSTALSMAESVARNYEPFSHPLRALLLAHGRPSWTALMKELGKLVGLLNPNTLAFHLKKLVESGYVAGSRRSV
ncbi:MAG: winged helix-turn-helix domain-containing protein [Sulfolobales archaeon]